jgi:Fic family protein
MQESLSNRQSTFAAAEDDDELIKDEERRALLEAENGLQQFDEVVRLAEQALPAKRIDLTPALVLELNRLAIQGIRRSAGQFRTVPIGISNTIHEPPPPEQVEGLVTEMCVYVNEHWDTSGDDLTDAVHLASYLMWRVNWIHPFRDGNGRTARAVSYLVLTARLGQLLPGEPTITDQIVDNKLPYYDALDDADAGWKENRLDLGTMERLITRLLEKQLSS